MTARFLTTLDVRYHSPDEWELLSPLVVTAEDKLIRVPPGFVTDFASVPRIPLAFMLFGNIGHRAATVHDYLYQTGQLPREEADAILRDLLLEEANFKKTDGMTKWQRFKDYITRGFGKAKAWLMYAGVRVGGASHYKEQ